MKKVLIIGLGRFGTLLVKILRDDFTVYVSSQSNKQAQAIELGVEWVELEKGLKKCDVIFYCVPISKFESIILSHLEILKKLPPKLIIDIQSVKVLPKKVLERHLPKHHQAILTHPIFGPDSVKKNGLAGMKIVVDQFLASDDNYLFWKKYFQKKRLQVVELTAKEHDRQAALSQGVVFFIGRVLEDFGFARTQVDTFWAEQLYQIVYEAVANDTWELFTDLQVNNPFTKQMRINLGFSLDKIDKKLLPDQVDENKITIGIQGGEGSFTHQALLSHFSQKKIDNFTIKFLYTSQKVLDSLTKGDIDLGLMAIHNSVGGVVEETIQAMANHRFNIAEEISVPIRHFLMKRKGTSINNIKTVMAHPQVIKQCKATLKNKYDYLNFESGKGDLIDHSAVAKALMNGEIDSKIGVMGPKTLATIYDLEIIGSDLQDSKNNITSFLLVKR